MESSIRNSTGYSKSYVKRKYNHNAVKEYRAQSPALLQKYLLERCQCGYNLEESWSKTLYGCVLLADISGFTKLASAVEAEDLKVYINDFFSLLLGRVIKRFGGDVVKFCGDAILVVWATSNYSSANLKRACIQNAAECALDLLRKCDNYSNEKMVPGNVQLRLHCGISAGALHIMSLGNSERMEFLISGSLMKDLGDAESAAKAGELCMSRNSFELVEEHFEGDILYAADCVRVTSKRMAPESVGFVSCLPFGTRAQKRKSKKLSRVYLKQDSLEDNIDHAESNDSSEWRQMAPSSNIKDSKEFKKAMIMFVHKTPRAAILNKTSDHLAELRQVVTIFIQIMNLEDDFNSGNHQRPQLAFLQVLDAMERLEGTVRQYVVDDKGCVIICAFGLPGFSSFNDGVRAVSAAVGIRDGLLDLGITCRIGIAQGMAYCGYVGSKYRKEYCIIGSSVNLAARLMCHGDVSQILVDGNVFLVAQDDFSFEELPRITAKGYADPVQVFSPKMSIEDGTFEEIARRSSTVKHPVVIGRAAEVLMLQRAVYEFSMYPSGMTRPGECAASPEAKKQLAANDEDESLDEFSGECPQAVVAPESPKLYKKKFHGVFLQSDTADICSRDSDDEVVSTKNKIVVTGCAGYGKTALITEIIRKNFMGLFTMARLTCHVASMFEPYEALTQIFKAVIVDSDIGGGGTLSPKLQASFKCDSNLSLTQDENDPYGDSETEVKSDTERSNFENQIREEVFLTVQHWATEKLSALTFEIVEQRGRPRAESALSMSQVDATGIYDGPFYDSDDAIEDEDLFNEICPPTPVHLPMCQIALHTGDVGIDSRKSLDSKFYSVIELLPLMRICFNSSPHQCLNIQSKFESSTIEEILRILAAEILGRMIPQTKSRALVVEDLQWCDKPTFSILVKMLRNFPVGLFIGSMRPSEKGTSSFSHKFARIASFEGSVEVNSIDDIREVCHLISLGPFGKSEVTAVVEHVFGEKLLKSAPHVVSEQSILDILARSENGMVGKVFEQVRLLESNILKEKYGSTKLDGVGHGLQQFDRLNNETQVVLKMACVCGTSFTVMMLSHVLVKMGYVSISNHITTFLRELEDKGIVKRVFASSCDGGSAVAMSTSFSQRRMGILSIPQTSRGLVLNDDRLYTFLNKKFRENIYAIMLESQRAAVHAVIGAKLEQDFEDSIADSLTKRTETVESLSFHFSRANNLANEIKYARETVKLARKGYLIATAHEYLNRVILLCTQQRSCEQMVKDLLSQDFGVKRQSSKIKYAMTRIQQESSDNLQTTNYVVSSSLQGEIKSVCSLINDHQLYDLIAQMSVLEYMQSELTNCHNFSILAQHLRKLGQYSSIPKVLAYVIREPSSRLEFGVMFLYQADLFAMRGLGSEAICALKKAEVLIPNTKTADRAQLYSLLSTVEIFRNPKASQRWGNLVEGISLLDRTKLSFSYVKLHYGIRCFVAGDFKAAERYFIKASTRVLVRKDCSPVKAQLISLTNWLHFLMGDQNSVLDSSKTIHAEEDGLRKIWGYEVLVVMYVMQGRYMRCHEILHKLKAVQGGRYGVVFFHALSGLVGVLEGKHLSLMTEDRDAVMSSLLYAANKLSARTQNTPVGIICLFWVSYAIASILHPEIGDRAGGTGCNTVDSLNSSLKKCLASFSVLPKFVPFLEVLNDVLIMKQAIVTKRIVKRFDENYFKESILTEKYPQFAFGNAMWIVEKEAYRSELLNLKDENAQLSECPILRMFGVPDNHAFFHLDSTPLLTY